MKEIKAFIPQYRIADVLDALRDSGLCNSGTGAGCHNIHVSRIQRPFAGSDPVQQQYSVELAEPVLAEYKLELLCADDLVDTLMNLVSQAAHTGQPSSGWIVVSNVEHAVQIP